MDLNQAAAFLRVTRATLDRWIRQGLVAEAGFRGGRFDPDLLARWARRRGMVVERATSSGAARPRDLLADAVERGVVTRGASPANSREAIVQAIESLHLGAAAHERLLEHHDDARNFWLGGWLRAQHGKLVAQLAAPPPTKAEVGEVARLMTGMPKRFVPGAAPGLHAVYQYFEDPIPLQQVIDETPTVEGGGTLAVMLASRAGQWICGQTLVVDGGMMAGIGHYA